MTDEPTEQQAPLEVDELPPEVLAYIGNLVAACQGAAKALNDLTKVAPKGSMAEVTASVIVGGIGLALEGKHPSLYGQGERPDLSWLEAEPSPADRLVLPNRFRR